MQSDFCVTFAAMNKILQQQAQWSENVILADADYIDKVAFNLTVNFERMIGRRIPQADRAKWLCSSGWRVAPTSCPSFTQYSGHPDLWL